MENKNFIDKINAIKKEFVPLSTTIKKQNNVLDSDIHNFNFKNIESKLNTLYDKTRTLEDAILYTKQYLNDSIVVTRDKVSNKLKAIESSRDELKDSSYITHVLDMQQDFSAELKDRDGTELNHVEISNSNIVMSSQDVLAARIVNSSVSSEIRCYNNNIKNIPGLYRTFYLLDGVVKNGVKEIIEVKLDKPSTINSIDLKPSNCKVIAISVINELGIEEQILDINNKYISNKKIIGAKVSVLSSNYKKEVYEIDNTRTAPNFWNRVKEQRYRTLTGQSLIYDLEKDSGIENYKRDYNKYIQDLKRWELEKASVDNRNKLLMDKWQHDMDEWTRQYGNR